MTDITVLLEQEEIDRLAESCSETYGSCIEAPYKWVGRREAWVLIQTGPVDSPNTTQQVLAFQTFGSAFSFMDLTRRADFTEYFDALRRTNVLVPHWSKPVTLPTDACVAAANRLVKVMGSTNLQQDLTGRDIIRGGATA